MFSRNNNKCDKYNLNTFEQFILFQAFEPYFKIYEYNFVDAILSVYKEDELSKLYSLCFKNVNVDELSFLDQKKHIVKLFDDLFLDCFSVPSVTNIKKEEDNNMNVVHLHNSHEDYSNLKLKKIEYNFDFILRLIEKHLIDYKSCIDGNIRVFDILFLNNYIDMSIHNQNEFVKQQQKV